MTFNTEKRKLFKLWNNSAENQFIIDELSSNDKIIFTKIQSLNETNTVYNNIINLSSGWITPQKITFASSPENVFYMFQEFEVIFKGIDKSLIPYIESKIAYRLGNSTNSIPIPVDGNGTVFDEVNFFDFSPNSFTEITRVSGVFKRDIVYKTSVTIKDGTNTSLPEQLEVQFFINIVNPNYYQST